MPGQKRVFALDVPGTHVFFFYATQNVDGRDECSIRRHGRHLFGDMTLR
jgi:hypothetical protein